MQNSTAATAATLEELAAQVAKLRARLDANEAIDRLADLVELPRPQLRLVASCYTGRKRTAPRGKLKLVGGAR